MSSTKEESPAQRALAAILETDDDTAKRVRSEPVKAGKKPIHRTKLWVYATGHGKPNVETAAFLERITDGAVKANEWVEKPEPVEVAPVSETFRDGSGDRVA